MRCVCVCVCVGGGGGGDSVCGEEGLKGVVVPCREGSEAGHARGGWSFPHQMQGTPPVLSVTVICEKEGGEGGQVEIKWCLQRSGSETGLLHSPAPKGHVHTPPPLHTYTHSLTACWTAAQTSDSSYNSKEAATNSRG